jgi:hypothetical protein
VLPELDWMIARALQGMVAVGGSFVCFADGNADSEESVGGLVSCFNMITGVLSWMMKTVVGAQKWARANHAPQFLKILITYCQVLGSFTMFTIEWPPIAFKMIVWFKTTFKFEIVQMPGLSCILAGISSFENTLYMYTIGPLVFIVALMLPVAAAVVRGYRNEAHPESYRWRHAQVCAAEFYVES